MPYISTFHGAKAKLICVFLPLNFICTTKNNNKTSSNSLSPCHSNVLALSRHCNILLSSRVITYQLSTNTESQLQ